MGDLSRAGASRGPRRRARRRAHRLPRPRRQHRPGRRTDLRRRARPAAARDRRPPEADRAGRDDLVQVRPARARPAQPRGGGLSTLLDVRSRDSWPASRSQTRARLMRALSAAARCAPTGASSGEDPRSRAFFRCFTPIDELAHARDRARALSRGPRRPPRTSCAALRAIPWVFAWTQNRCLLPAWYGCGTALATADVGRCAALQRWPFFRALIENLEMTLAKSSMRIAPRLPRACVHRRPTADRIWATLEAEQAHAVDVVLAIVEADRLLDRHPQVQRSVALRNPYVDPINAMQVELLGRYRGRRRERRCGRCCARSPASPRRSQHGVARQPRLRARRTCSRPAAR